MSTTVEQTRQYAEFDEYIEFQLKRLRSGIRMNDVFTALCGIAVIVTAYLLTFVVLDHWVIDGGFSHSTRLLSMLLLLIGTAAWVGLRVVRPCLQRVNSLYAASLAEATSEELESNLLNYEDLRRAGRPVPKQILKALEKRAAVALSKTDVDDAVDRRLLLRLSVSLLSVVLIFCLYTVFSPKKVWPSIWRAVNPVTSTQVATQTEIVDVQPGNKADVLARTLLEVTVDLRGEIPAKVELVYSTLDRSLVDERIPLRRADETLKRFAGVLAGPEGDGLLQGLTYHIEAGDAVSPPYRIDVIQPPSVSVEQIHYAYPDYMELRPERRESPVIDVWEGSRLTFSASTNMPVQRAWIEFSDTESFPLNPEPLPMDIEDGTRLSVEWQAMIRDEGMTPRFYRIRCRTEAGATEPTPAVYPVEIHPDQKPQIEAVYPTADIERPANAIVPLLLRAADPDFRLTRVTLRSRHGNVDLSDRVLWRGGDRSAEVEHDLRLEDLGLKPGDVLTWWGEARDNRVIESPTRRLKDNNVSITPHLRIRISESVSDSEVVDQHAFDAQQRQERIDELNQEPRGSNDPDSADDSADRGADETADQERRNADGQKPEKAADSDSDDQQRADRTKSGEDSSQSEAGEGDSGEPSGQGPGEGSKSDSQSGEGTTTERSSDSDAESSAKASPDGDSPNGKQPMEASPSDDGQKGAGTRDRRPVSNDGSDDDQVLRELLQKQQQKRQTEDSGADDKTGKTAGEDAGAESADPGTESDTSSDNQGDTPGGKGDDSRESPGDSASPKGGESPSEKSNGSGETGTEKSDTDPQSGGSKEGTEKSKTDSDANQTSDSATQPGSNNERPNSTPNGSETPSDDGSSGDDRDSGNAAKGGSKKPDGSTDQPTENGTPSGADQKTDPSRTGSPAKSGESGAEKGTSSAPTDDASPGKPGSGQSGSKSGEASGSKSGGGGSPPKSGSKSEGEGGKSASKGGSSADKKPAGSEKSGGAGDSEKSATEDSVASKGGGGSEGTASKSESASDSEGSGEQRGSETDGKQREPTASGDQKSGSESASKSGGESKSGESGSGSGSSGSDQSGSPSSGGKGTGSKGGSPGQTKSSQGRPTAGDEPDSEPQAASGEGGGETPAVSEPVNVEDRLKATNLVLKQLQDDLDRGKVDQELLDKLGWTEDDMRRFTERLQQRLSTDDELADPGEAARARQFREMLKSLDLKASSRERLDAFEQKEATTDFSDLRERVPQKYRGAFEKYLDKLARQKRDTTP